MLLRMNNGQGRGPRNQMRRDTDQTREKEMKSRGIKQAIMAFTVTAAALAAPLAEATTGYFKLGYGAKSRGTAGLGAAYGRDALAPATNPATLSDVGTRMDAGLELFNPQREGTLDATFIGGAKSNENSGATLFGIPNFGVANVLSDRLSVGVAAVANGGLSTRYNVNIFDTALAPAAGVPVGAIPNTGTLGVNLAQLLLQPTAAYKLTPNHSIGVSAVVGYQTFRAFGLGDFAAFGFSSDPAHLTNKGNDNAWGLGGKVGYRGRFGPLRVGASYQSKVYMEEFKNYKGLFAEKGDFDIPATWVVGLALDVSPRVLVAFDVQRIEYSGVKAISNDGPTAAEFTAPFLAQPVARPLGTDNGFGFGWNDMTIYKLGAEFAYNDQWTFRAGYSHTDSPIDNDQNLFNILAPAVIEDHVTAGFTYAPHPNSEFTVTYMHAFRGSQKHTYDTSGILGPGTSYSADIAMQQHAIEASYAWKF